MFSKNITLIFFMMALMIIPLEVAHFATIPFNLNSGDQHNAVIEDASKSQDFSFDSVNNAVDSVNKTVKKMANVSSKHVHCIATAIYWEAAHEPYLGQIAVARVIMNRVIHGFASNPCAVVYQTTTNFVNDQPQKTCQFSWHCEGKTIPKNNHKYQEAVNIATQVLEENKWSELFPNNILFFHNTSVNPKWKHRRAMTIGNHIFYSSGRERKLKQEKL